MSNGHNKVKEYESRLRQNGSQLDVFCKHCEKWKPSTGFHMSNNKFKSMCKSCHSERYSKAAGYQSPSAKAKQEQARKKKEQWLNEPQTCTNCGETKPRKEFYNEKRKSYLSYCCSTRRSWDDIERDIAEQMKNCFECGLRLSFDEFPNGGNGRDGKKPYCKCCEAARMKVHSDRPDRVQWIKDTDDGTLSVKVLSAMLRKTTHCSHCGVEMNTSYPVTRQNKTIDHDIPLSRGGKHSIDNISILCLGCNSSKQDRTLAEFAKVVKKKRQK